MFTAIALMGGLGLVVGVGLAMASKIFYVYVNPLILAIDDVLPGANCGGCGLPGCASNAEAIVAGKAAPDSCVAAGAETAAAIAALMGVSVEASEPDIALPGCTYGVAAANTRFVYNGMTDCRAAAMLSGGMKVCTIGCLGLGTCAKVCPFDAISMGPDGLPKVHAGRCTGCGTCERVCPKHIITLSSVTRRILQEYTSEVCTTPCQRACPAGINISGYISAMAAGDHDRAIQIIKERNPFPTVIGRICPRPCEHECRRQYVDDPVAINFLKRYAADLERERGRHMQPYKAPPTGRKLAVVGGGVEGLSAAFFSARLGHDVTVIEADQKMGGLLKSAIARNRLPAEILEWDIEGIAQMGVTLKTGQTVGHDISIGDLLNQGHEALLLALGGWDSRLARTGGRGAAGPIPGGHLLIDIINAGSEGYPAIKLHGKVCIIGHPNLSAAMVRRCKDLGASEVSVLMRGAAPTELDGAEVIIDQGISRLHGQGEELTYVECTDFAGGSTKVFACDHIVFSAGRMPELIFIPAPVEQEVEGPAPWADKPVKWEAFAPYKQPAYQSESGLMARGDELTDFSAAIKAIAAGRRAAASLHKSIYGIAFNLPDNLLTPETEKSIQNVTQVSRVPVKQRRIMPLSDPNQVSRGMELEQGYSEPDARTEAERCLQCGLICYKSEAPQTALEEAVGA